MALVVKDRVRETTTTLGTGTVTLGGAVAGFQAFSVIGNGNTTYYTISDPATGAWEVGIGTYTSSGTTLSRDTVLESSNSNNLVNFGAGTKDVFVTYPADRSVTSDVSTTFTAAQTFRAANAVRSEAAATQDAVVVAGRAGGTNSYAVTLTPTTLTASRTFTLPDADGTALYSGGPLGTPSSGTLSSCSGLPISTGVSGLGTGVATALAVNTGTAGAFVVNGGALGTPSSGTVTNLTGTASININGTVGATTPNTGSFTSLTDSGNLTFTGTGNRITGDFSNGTVANRVAFQSSTTNGNTGLITIPNGTATQSGITLYANSSASDTTGFFIVSNTSESSLRALTIGTASYLPMTFYTGGSERMRIDSSGNVGIGVAPSVKLQVAGAVQGYQYTINTGSASNVFVAYTNNGSSRWVTGTSGAESSGNAGSDFVFNNYNDSGNQIATAVTIQRSSGNVGIGTNSPGTKLHAAGRIRSSNTNTSGATDAAGIFELGDNYVGIWRGAENSVTTAGNYLNIGGISGVIFTVSNAVLGSQTERLRIDSSGNVGIGTSSPGYTLDVQTNVVRFATTTAGYVQLCKNATATNNWHIGAEGDGTFRFWNGNYGSGTERARFTSGGNFSCVGVYNATVGATNRDVYVDDAGLLGYVSSIRASKTNINDITDVSWLHQLNPVSYQYRKKDEDGNYTDEADGPVDFGLIAEDTEAVKPELCFYDEVDGEQELRGINYSKLIVPMLKAIQEQQQQIDALKAEVQALKGN